jgi:hypothetical protein
MNINLLFDVPALVAQGLMNGSLEPVGGVVRDSSSKQQLLLPEGQAAAVVLDTRWLAQEVIA